MVIIVTMPPPPRQCHLGHHPAYVQPASSRLRTEHKMRMSALVQACIAAMHG